MPSIHNAVKREPYPGSSISWDDYVTISSDEEDETQHPVRTNYPSSDLIEVDANSWGQSNGQAVSGAFPLGNSMPGASSSNTGVMGSLNAIRSTAQGYAHDLSNTLGGTLSELGGLVGFGGTSVYGDSSVNVPIIDLEDEEDYGSGSFYQRNMTRAGLNPMDVELMDRYRQRYDYIAQDPTKTLKEMKELLENIRPDEDLPPENREGTPEAMKYPLMEHQKLGVAWMRRMEEGSNRGGSEYHHIQFLAT